jgi:hypothetical protein
MAVVVSERKRRIPGKPLLQTIPSDNGSKLSSSHLPRLRPHRGFLRERRSKKRSKPSVKKNRRLKRSVKGKRRLE